LRDLDAAVDKPARDAVIDAKEQVWRDLKEWLLAFSHGKCWFSDAKDIFSHWHVEHFRPKKDAKDEDGHEDDAYWWLAFDWTNYRICGSVGNSAKGTFFPLRPGTTRVGRTGDIRAESPTLLDPADPDDPHLLTFDLEGKAIPAAHVTDAWEKHRVEYSVIQCKLDAPQLANQRKTVWEACWRYIEEFRNELARYHADRTNLIAYASYKRAGREILRMLAPEQELSSVAHACVEFSGDPRVTALLRN